MLHQTHRQDMEIAKYFPDQRSIQYMLTTKIYDFNYLVNYFYDLPEIEPYFPNYLFPLVRFLRDLKNFI